jgi:hypothetical protein
VAGLNRSKGSQPLLCIIQIRPWMPFRCDMYGLMFYESGVSLLSVNSVTYILGTILSFQSKFCWKIPYFMKI